MATALVSITPECSICCENLKTPKVLTCGHTFCYECIDRYIGDKKETFPCPICQQDIKIPEGGAKMFITCFMLQTSPNTTQVTGTPTSSTTQVTGTPTWPQISGITDQPVKTPTHHCPNHSKKEVEYYCQTCSLGLCSKCILKDHMDHKKLDLECDSTRETVVKDLSQSEQIIKNKIEDFEQTHATLLETSKKLKSFCDEACTKISEKTEKIIGQLKENCEKIQMEIRDNFDKNESKLTETRQKVITQIKNIKTDLDTSCPTTTTEEPSLTLIYSLAKLQDLQKLCENMKTDIPPVTYVEWREGSVKVCDILGSTVTKPLHQSRHGGWRRDDPDTNYKWPSPDSDGDTREYCGYPEQPNTHDKILITSLKVPGQIQRQRQVEVPAYSYAYQYPTPYHHFNSSRDPSDYGCVPPCDADPIEFACESSNMIYDPFLKEEQMSLNNTAKKSSSRTRYGDQYSTQYQPFKCNTETRAYDSDVDVMASSVFELPETMTEMTMNQGLAFQHQKKESRLREDRVPLKNTTKISSHGKGRREKVRDEM